MKQLPAIKGKTLIILILSLLLASTACICAVYLLDFYKANDQAIAEFKIAQDIKEYQLKKGVMIFEPQNATSGMIFYPGGKVEYTAYIPLMRACAERGILCIIVKMPFNLAVLNINAADGFLEKYPEIESWYIGGHSLGGAMAASYLDKNATNFDGIIFLGAYSTVDISDEKIEALSVYGSEDGVMDREKYEQSRENLPSNFEERIIEGGSHAYFGMYGHQDGDGTPSITNEEQILFTANIVYEFIRE